jgi:hypothetical protein
LNISSYHSLHLASLSALNSNVRLLMPEMFILNIFGSFVDLSIVVSKWSKLRTPLANLAPCLEKYLSFLSLRTMYLFYHPVNSAGLNLLKKPFFSYKCSGSKCCSFFLFKPWNLISSSHPFYYEAWCSSCIFLNSLSCFLKTSIA